MTKKNFARALEAVQVAFEVEAKGKTEALRMKKKLETSVSELDGSLEHENAANTESRRQIDLLLTQIRASQQKLEEESRSQAARLHWGFKVHMVLIQNPLRTGQDAKEVG